MATATAKYFATDEQLKAKKWDMLEETKALKARLASLESDLKKFALSWSEMGALHQHSGSWDYQIGEKELEVLNPSRQFCNILTVQWEHFDAVRIKLLLGDIQQTKNSLAEAEKGLRDLGAGEYLP